MNYRLFLALAYSGYFFFCAIPHTPAARYSFLGLSFLAAAANLYQSRRDLRWRSPILITTAIFTVISFASAATSPYQTESLSAFRKEYLTPSAFVITASLLPWSNQQSKQFVTFLVSAIGLGFVVKTLLAFWDGAINHPWVFSPYSNPEFFELNGLPRYVGYFAIDSGLYIPLILGSILFWFGRSLLGITLLIGTVLAYAIILVSGIRTAFVVATLAIFLLLLARFNKPKYLVMLAIALACVFGALKMTKINLELQRYAEIFKPVSYTKEKGMSDRYPIWQATAEVAALRPALGFGPGWQKLPVVAKESGLLDVWKSDSSIYAQRKAFWFGLAPGQTNPHNLAMQLIFEIGAVGLLCYAVILASLLMTAWKARRNPTAAHTRWFGVTVFVFMVCYLALSTTNGLLLPSTLVVLLITAVVTTPSLKQKL